MSVIIYSTPFCPWCKVAKGFLTARKITYTEINVSGNKKAVAEMVKKSGQYSVPVIDINGKIIVGFDEEALTKALKK
ncbi:MAG: glutaredoxin family protein [Nanoarchaeota archaeon]